MVVKFGVHSVTRTTLDGTSIPESLHAEFCRSFLNIQRKTPTNTWRSELDSYQLIINIKKTFKFYISNWAPKTHRFQALQTQELNLKKSPFCHLVRRLTDQITPNTVQPQTSTAFNH